jgi:hypothetical protein
MPPRSATGRGAQRARLYQEAERLTERYRSRLSATDLDAGAAFVEQRAAILARIDALGAPSGDDDQTGESIAAIERMIALNRELVTLLEAEKSRVRRQLAGTGAGRAALGSYAIQPISPVFVDQKS